jgi:hypothetical protein
MAVIWIDSGRFAPAIALDPNAAAYIAAVEAADTQALEPAVRAAINDFVVGCKADGIWAAIKASCILAGARTLNGALVPLSEAAPTNFNFVAGDYNRKTGLSGGSLRYLDSNRPVNADPQNSFHQVVYKTNTVITAGAFLGTVTSPFDLLDNEGGVLRCFSRNINSAGGSISMVGVTGFMGHSRASSSQVSARGNGTTVVANINSSTPSSVNSFVFARNSNGVAQSISTVRLAFYSIGESLDLALFDARVTALINAFDAAI